jgi:hypothetical protein
MTINDEILAIANQLANQGKQPSVALIKTKLTRSVPLPTIISVLKGWQHDPSFTQKTQVNKKESKIIKEENIDINALIQQAIAPLQQEINELKLQVKQILKK